MEKYCIRFQEFKRELAELERGKTFKMGLIDDDGKWIKMLKMRNLLTHDYDGQIALQEVDTILNQFFFYFVEFRDTMETFYAEHDPL